MKSRFNLETVVGRIRVCGFRVVWQGAMRRMAAPCNEEQRSQATRKACNRVRSAPTQPVKLRVTPKLNIHRVPHAFVSGQLRFSRFIALVAAAILCASCDQPTQPPPPKTDQPYTGIYQDQVNALEKTKQAGDAMQQSVTERQQKTEQATQ